MSQPDNYLTTISRQCFARNQRDSRRPVAASGFHKPVYGDATRSKCHLPRPLRALKTTPFASLRAVANDRGKADIMAPRGRSKACDEHDLYRSCRRWGAGLQSASFGSAAQAAAATRSSEPIRRMHGTRDRAIRQEPFHRAGRTSFWARHNRLAQRLPRCSRQASAPRSVDRFPGHYQVTKIDRSCRSRLSDLACCVVIEGGFTILDTRTVASHRCATTSMVAFPDRVLKETNAQSIRSA